MKNEILNPFSDNDVSSGNYFRVVSEKKETVWTQLKQITVQSALEAWYRTLPLLTKKNYQSGFNRIMDLGLVDPNWDLQYFALINHESKVDEIKLLPRWSEATRQARAAGYISFTAFLQRRTQGVINKAISNKEGVSKTFFKIRDKVKTPTLTKKQTINFFIELKKINYRDYLIAKVILQGGKRKGEVLALERKNIDFENNRITFKQSKTRGVIKQTVVNYPEVFMNELGDYLKKRAGIVYY